MDLTVAVKGEFTTNTKAQWTEGATLQTLSVKNNDYGNIKLHILKRGGGI